MYFRICRGGGAGVAVNERALGYILENYISNNRYGGVDIRHGSHPTVGGCVEDVCVCAVGCSVGGCINGCVCVGFFPEFKSNHGNIMILDF